jgi:hypothetical protein
MDTCTFTQNHARDDVINTHTGYRNEVFAYNSTFTNNDGGVFQGDVAEFTNCTFDQNGVDYTFRVGMYVHHMVVLRDCSLGNSTFYRENLIEFVETDAENGAGSIFGEGSLTMIISILALIASGTAIFLVVYYNKKKAAPVAANGATDTETDDEE